MAKHLVIAVDWYGPYRSLDEAQAAMRDEGFSAGLYFAIGRLKPKEPITLQYVGISRRLASRVSHQHSALSRINDLQLWVGEVATANPSGRKLKATPPSLDFAEWLTAFFLEMPLNTMKRTKIPNMGVSLLNRWWKKSDYETPYVRRPHPDWPDFIDFQGHYYPTKLVWFGKKMKRVGPIEILAS